jgi:hypothetical protein
LITESRGTKAVPGAVAVEPFTCCRTGRRLGQIGFMKYEPFEINDLLCNRDANSREGKNYA